ncbi:Proteophosphoglycan ppg4 [Pyrrhoderma noxium]|uniref:Proteophosphoglycan ppg4 n=1 Tax=Pyrrhoderma noxium TaxID=2282107 RepID=A0A286UDK0_9AGAM|nr:Proteophosphoglycan ppg4 [Pyrrhoderma noxium]
MNTATDSQAGAAAADSTAATTGGGGDALDKGIDFLGRKTGHQQSHSTTEKISDGIRKGFRKLTGKDVPIKDQDYS